MTSNLSNHKAGYYAFLSNGEQVGYILKYEV
jgi:hypothetical protein